MYNLLLQRHTTQSQKLFSFAVLYTSSALISFIADTNLLLLTPTYFHS